MKWLMRLFQILCTVLLFVTACGSPAPIAQAPAQAPAAEEPEQEAPVAVMPEPITGGTGEFLNIQINSVEFEGSVGDADGVGELQLITIVSDEKGHSDALICPYGAVNEIRSGDRINPCKAGISYSQSLIKGNLYIMIIAMDNDDAGVLGDVATGAVSSGLAYGLKEAISAAGYLSGGSTAVLIGSLALDTVVGYAGSKVQEYFEKSDVIGSQSFVLSRTKDWNNNKPVVAKSEGGDVEFSFTVQQSSTADGQLVNSVVPSAPTKQAATPRPAPTATSAPANVVSTSHSASVSCADRLYFVRLRRSPGYNNKDEVLDTVAEVPCGEFLEILDGPTQKDNLNWYEVSWNGLTGWMADHTSTGKVVLIFE